MATLVLQTAGQAIGGLIGGPVGALIGRGVGAIAGSFIDQSLFGPPRRSIEGRRLTDLHILSSSEGAPVPRVWGRMRLGGQMIWATNLEEDVTTRSEGGGKGSPAPETTVTEYTYYANFAVALCEGPVARIGRVWADGKELDLSPYTWRFYRGDETQTPDSLITAKEGADNSPAYRGTAYVVFERLPLERFGNRIPQLSFEVFRPVDDVEKKITAVNMIPGSTEFGYDTDIVKRSGAWGETLPENTHVSAANTDWSESLDQLQAVAPNLGSVSLVVSWFGDDLRCGNCLLRPGVENAGKSTSPHAWTVAGESRQSAYVVSQIDGRPAFGGTPSDDTVVRAIADLTARGLKVQFYPFILMDIPTGNTLPDPESGGVGQPAYPWRGRITCDPAPGLPGTPDKSAAVASQIANLIGTAAPGDFSISTGSVVYSGPAEWSLRRMVLHYAHLCALAGGVDTFIIASELVRLTTLRDSASGFPVVSALKQLGDEVAAVLPAAKISYAADWSEYFGYHPADASNDVYFHLDEFWASPSVAFVGIDNYMPLSDWRDGSGHADALAGFRSIYELDYLKANVAAGEGYDWYYASSVDRDAQIRTPITDGQGKPWVFRYKDLESWWRNPHYHRPGGAENASPTGWVPESKPIRFTEAGCPAVDKGPNQPNVFFDPKSSQSQLPYYSSGLRDDFVLRRYIEALIDYWDPLSGNNPVSVVYGSEMVEPDGIHIWAWDARPYPAFPYRTDVWSDGENYARGHWLNGRLGAVSIAGLLAGILDEYGFVDYEIGDVEGVVDGYVIDSVMSARSAIDPLGDAFAFDALESSGKITFRSRRTSPVAEVFAADLVEQDAERPLYALTRAQETELPSALKMNFAESAIDYRRATADARRLTASSVRHRVLDLPAALPQSVAQARTDIRLQEIWVGRETASFTLPPSAMKLEPGDAIDFSAVTNTRTLRIEMASEGDSRRIDARTLQASVYEHADAPARGGQAQLPKVFGAPRYAVMDMPMLREQDDPYAPWVAASALPWPGTLAVLRDQGSGSFVTNTTLRIPAAMGETSTVLSAGPLDRFDRVSTVSVQMFSGALQSVNEAELLAGSNAIAIGDSVSGWEIIQFMTATLTGSGQYDLSLLLRGQRGSEPEMLASRPPGAQVVVLDRAVRQLQLQAGDIGLDVDLRIGPASLDAGDPAYVDVTVMPQGLGLRPLPPVHVTASDNGGDTELSWIRQTRIGGDSWQLDEVPLGEDDERYEVDIMNGAAVVRTIVSAQPSATYTSAQQIADWGAPQTELDVAIYQLSATYGRGAVRRTIVNV